jgi:hypothetical protein
VRAGRVDGSVMVGEVAAVELFRVFVA